LIINKTKPPERRGKVLFINSELEFEEGKNQNKLRQQDIEKIVQTFECYAEYKRYSKVVTLAEVVENDCNLNIRLYADTSPPPEMFDVRAILHGGIPVREVESEHIREDILEGFNILTVFVRRNDDYYDFKSGISTKETIREIVTDVDDKVITQLERWWDKYHLSLNELDKQVDEVTDTVKGYLKELGYE